MVNLSQGAAPEQDLREVGALRFGPGTNIDYNQIEA
jgi:hypothetical protein